MVPLAHKVGFQDIEVYAPHAQPDGDFPNVPGHVSNPENSAIFEAPIEHAQKTGADLILATDPDCDRIGVAAPMTTDPAGPWRTFSGNEIGALLAQYILSKQSAAGTLTPKSYLVKTLVTTELIRRIASSYDVRCVGDLLVGFKYIAEVMDREGADDFVFGTEESHGYLVGQYCRDKDGAIACVLMCELAAELKAKGKSMHDYLCDLHRQHGYHRETLINLFMEGSEGMAAMQRLMKSFRTSPPTSVAGIKIAKVNDYAVATTTTIETGATEKLDGPEGDLIILDLAEEGNYIAVRPSGTEPKIKLYVFTRLSTDQSADLDQATATLKQRLDLLEKDVRAYAKENC